jgi:hypothetical protein
MEKLREHLSDVPGLSKMDMERVELAAAFYKLLNQKYNLGFTEMSLHLAQLKSEAFRI